MMPQPSAVYVNLNIWYLAFEDLAWIERLKRFHVIVGHPVNRHIVEKNYMMKRGTLFVGLLYLRSGLSGG